MAFTKRLAVVALMACINAPWTATADEYPSKPITMVVPLPPGGPTDQLARIVAPKITEKLGQNVIIENVSGGATTIGTGRVARAAPDGYTLLMHSLQIASNPGLYPKLPFDTEKDLVPVSFINYNPLILIGRKSLPPETFPELVAWMKRNPAKIGVPGLGSTGHMTAVLFANAVGAKADLIPYRGAAPAIQDIFGEHIDLYFAAPQSIVEAVRANTLKAYGITSRDRWSLLPQVPSLVELLGNDMDVLYWSGLFARAGTPQPIIDTLNAAVEDVFKDDAVLKLWAEAGVIPYSVEQRSPKGGQEIFQREIKRWGEVIRANKIEVQMQ